MKSTIDRFRGQSMFFSNKQSQLNFGIDTSPYTYRQGQQQTSSFLAKNRSSLTLPVGCKTASFNAIFAISMPPKFLLIFRILCGSEAECGKVWLKPRLGS